MLPFKNKSLFIFCICFSLFVIPFTGVAQNNSDENFPNKGVVLKINAISPAVGMTFPINDQSAFRAMGFISTNFDDFGSNNFYYFDLSYIRQHDWITGENISTYWGADLNFRLDGDGIIAPGAFVGTSFRLSQNFSIFGEAGLNLFIIGDNDAYLFGMHNTGIGIKLTL